MKNPTKKQSWKLRSESKQTYRARMNLARESAAIIDKKVNDLVFPVFVYRQIIKSLR